MWFEIAEYFYGSKYRKFKKINVNKFIEKYKIPSSNLDNYTKAAISRYCKENHPSINKYLRENKILNEEEKECRDILDNVLSNEIGENIVVYRKMIGDPFKGVFFTEKGYMSTSLIDGDINQIHQGEFMLKILVPANCKGFYVDYISCRNGEYEMLLNRNITLKRIAYKKQKKRMLVLCLVINCKDYTI